MDSTGRYDDKLAFQRLIDHVAKGGAYKPRDQAVSSRLSREILVDLFHTCEAFRSNVIDRKVAFQVDCKLSAGDRTHKIDLVLGSFEHTRKTGTDIKIRCSEGCFTIQNAVPAKVQLFIEHKSLITAHRNVRNRTRILKDLADFMNDVDPSAIRMATWMLGTATRYLNMDKSEVGKRSHRCTLCYGEEQQIPNL